MKKIITLFALSLFGLIGIKSNAQCSLTDAPQFSNATNTSSFCQGAVVQFVVSAVVTDNSSNTFSYSWNTGGTYDTIVVPASAIAAGTYNYCCSVTDGISCNTYDCVTLTVNSLPALTITSGPVCSGQVTTLTDVVTDPSSNIIAYYAWSPSSSTSDTADIVITSNATELSEVEDGNGCISNVASINLVPNTPPVVTVTPSFDTICIGGFATLTANVTLNNTTSYNYSWTDGSTNSIDDASPAATSWQTVTFTDGNGCWDTASSYVSVDYITGNFTMNPNPVCIGSWSTVGLALTQGVSLPLTYSWSTGGTNDTVQVSPTAASTYTVTVSDHYCTASGISPVLEVHGVPSVYITSSISPVCYLSAAILTSHVTDTANSAFTYAWSNSSTFDTADVTPPINTIYTLTVSDGNGCSGTASILQQVWPLPIVTFNSIGFGNPVCQGNNALTITGGSPTGGTYSGPNVSGGMFTPSALGSNKILYSYTDGHGCTDTASFDVTVNLCSGTSTLLLSSDYAIYPNPTLNNVYVKFNSAAQGESASITITDVTGRVVAESFTTVNNELIVPMDVSTLSSGVYFIKIVSGNISGTSRFVKE